MSENKATLKDKNMDLNWYKKNVPKLSIILGVIQIVIALLFIELSRTKGLYICIAACPIIMSLIAYLRYLNANTNADIAKIVVETAWFPLSFGLGYFILAPSSYYEVSTGAMILVLIDAACMMLLGLKTLISLSKKGFPLTP